METVVLTRRLTRTSPYLAENPVTCVVDIMSAYRNRKA
jgi:DTW domain-containing protein YfiP